MRTDRSTPGCGTRRVPARVVLVRCCSRCSRWPLPRRSRSWARSAARSPTPRAASSPRRLGPDHRRGDRRPAHRRNRRRGPLRGDEPPPGHLPGRDRHHELQEVRADERRPARHVGVARVDAKLELGVARRVGHGLGRGARATSSLESPAVAQGLDEQQLRDLPRNSRDMQSFLLAEPERARRQRRHAVPRRPHLRRLLHPGRPGLHERDLRHGRQLGAGPRRHLRDPGPLQLLQRRVRRPRRRRGHDQARRQRRTGARRSTTSTRTA